MSNKNQTTSKPIVIKGVEEDKKLKFKILCTKNKTTMSDVLKSYIDDYIIQNNKTVEK